MYVGWFQHIILAFSIVCLLIQNKHLTLSLSYSLSQSFLYMQPNVISSPRKSSNHLSWSTTNVRSITLHMMIGRKWSVLIFSISYILMIPSIKIHVSYAQTYHCCIYPWLRCIQYDIIIFTLITFIDTSDSCHCCGSSDSMKTPIQYETNKHIWSHSSLYCYWHK